MNDSGGQRWLGVAILVGVIYAAFGIAPGILPATTVRQVRIWRVSAFVVSGVVFAAHIAFEHFRHRHAARRTAWHTSAAVALGALGLAVSANLHDLTAASGYRPRMLVALVAWPLVTAVPAFLAALVVAAGLGLKRRRD